MGDHAESLTKIKIPSALLSSTQPVTSSQKVIEHDFLLINPCYADSSQSTSSLSYLEIILAPVRHFFQYTYSLITARLLIGIALKQLTIPWHCLTNY